jgi:hypothetical protein
MAIRSHTLVDKYEYVSRFDEAVDQSVEDFEQAWQRYRDGTAQPPLKLGEEPTRFTLRHVTSTERLYLFEITQAGGERNALYLAAAAVGLVSVKGLTGADGAAIEIRQEVTRAGPLKIRSATKDSLDAIPWEVLMELGSVVLERSAVRPS